MAISISKMIDEVASNKYNKTNILFYILIMAFLEIVTISIFTINSKDPANIILSLILGIVIYFIFIFITDGYFVITANKEIHNKKSVFPSFSFDILNKGFIYSLGNTLVSIILYFIPIIIILLGFCLLFTSAAYTSPNLTARLSLMLAGTIIALTGSVIMIVLAYYYYYPLKIQYLISLKFNDFFNFKKATMFRNNRKGLYKSYFWQTVLLCFFYSTIVSMFFSVIIALNPKMPTNTALILQVLQGNIIYILYVLTIPNLTGQIVNQTNSKIKTTPKENTSENQA